ncbi:MAG: sensor histidine kinase [Planctomycetia bacterium]
MAALPPSGAWLLLDRDSSAPIALPVPRQACLGLTRAVLFLADGWRQGSGGHEAAWQAVWEHAGADLSAALWLASREFRDATGRSPARSLAESLVLGDDVRSGRASVADFITESAWAVFVSAGCGLSWAGAEPWCRDKGRRIEMAGELLGRILAGAAEPVTGPVPAVEPAVESLVLRDAIRAAVSLESCAGRFEAAVSEARLAAMREMAYGAGHEINNPLANIAARAQALLVEEHDPERRRRLSTIVDQAFRARDMIGGLMLFARPPKPRPRNTDVGALTAAVVDAVEPQAAARGARLEYSPPPFPLTAWGDATQLEEAVRALVVNAVEAVDPGGRIVLAVEGPIVRSNRERACVISVSDDGHGMDEETAKRAFDPFFSGREAGRGVGLGLSKAWRLIDTNGGAIVIESRRGRGTRVSVTLPCHDVALETATR